MIENNDSCDLKVKHLDLTWKWFEYHAKQRMQTFYYFLLITGALSWGYFSCISNCNSKVKMLSPYIALLSILASIAFFFIELRNAELVNIGRVLLRRKEYEAAIVDRIDRKGDFSEELYNVKRESLKGSIKISQLEPFVRHELWLRFVYLVCFLYGVGAFFISLPYLIDGYIFILSRFSRLGILLIIFTPKNLILFGVFVGFVILLFILCLSWKRDSNLLDK